MVNPYYLYSIIFTIVLFLYELGWSSINPILSLDLKLFLYFSILFFIILGYFFSVFTKKNNIQKEKKYSNKLYNSTAVFIVIGIIFEGFYSGGLPIFNKLSYSNFGVPMFHVILFCVSFFFILVSFENFLVYKQRRDLLRLFIGFIPFIVTINRGLVVMASICLLLIFIRTYQIKFTLKRFSLLLLGALIFFYLFGIFGNFRIHKDYERQASPFDSELIMDVGGATNKFQNSFIPKPYFWTYSYVTSPIANLEATNSFFEKNKGAVNNYTYLFITQFIPDFISKRVYPIEKHETLRVKEEMTVATTFSDSISIIGSFGKWVFLLVMSVIPFIYMHLIERFSPEYYNISLSIICCIYILSFFTNFFSYTALSLQLTFPFILSFIKKIKF